MEEIPELFDVGGARGRRRVRARRVLRRALPRPAPARRDPVPGRHARQRRRGRHPRLLAAAPAPEARRGGAGAVPDRRADRRALRVVQGDLREAGYVGAGTVRVPGRAGRHDLVPRGQHPAAGRAPGDRGGHRHRPGPRAVPDRRRRGARLRRPAGRAGTRSSSGSTARTPGAASCPPRARSPTLAAAAGPGVRLDSGVEAGAVVAGAFDSLLAKLIVTGRHRGSRRSSGPGGRWPSSWSTGMPTVLPFHRAVVDRPRLRRRRDRSRCTPAGSRPSSTTRSPPYARAPADAAEPAARETRRGRGRRQAAGGRAAGRARRRRPAARGPARAGAARRRARAAAAGGRRRRADRPMQGTIVKIAVEDGRAGRGRRPGRRARGDEDGAAADAHKAGTVTGLAAEVGETVTCGAVICEIKD